MEAVKEITSILSAMGAKPIATVRANDTIIKVNAPIIKEEKTTKMRQYLLYTYGENTIFNTLNEAIEFANANNMNVIQEIEGHKYLTEFKKCRWCDNWVDSTELRESWACRCCRFGK